MKPQFLIVGIGNPGKQYANTRHNVGYQAVESSVSAFGAREWSAKQKFLSLTAEGNIDGIDCLFVKPETYMNRSGEAIGKLLKFYKLSAGSQLLVFCDDVDIELGSYRLRLKGGPGTHNGLKSIVDAVGENFPRIRIGIGPQPEKMDLAAWVLSALTKEEAAKLDGIYKQLPTLIRVVLRELKLIA